MSNKVIKIKEQDKSTVMHSLQGADFFEERHNQTDCLFAGSPRILLAEDNCVNQFVIRTNLVMAGCQTDVVRDGMEAMAMFEKNKYALILLDIRMPKMNGIEVAKKIRAYEKSGLSADHKNILIASTAFGSLVFDLCLAAGFDECHDKPMLQNDLIALLKKWLPQYLATKRSRVFIKLCQPIVYLSSKFKRPSKNIWSCDTISAQLCMG